MRHELRTPINHILGYCEMLMEEARLPKEQTQRQLARNLLQRAFDGSAKSLVLGALSSQKVSSAELAEIRQMLDQFEKGSR